jgi:hypothetical protein
MSGSTEFPTQRLLEAWSKGWTTGDIEGLTKLWDPNYSNLTFLATERDVAARTYAAVHQYYTDLLTMFVPQTWIPSEVIIDRLTEDLVFLRCKVRMDYTLPSFEGEPQSFWRARVFQIWRRQSDNDWKLIHKEDSTNEFDRAVNLVGRLAKGVAVPDVLKVYENWRPFVPQA